MPVVDRSPAGFGLPVAAVRLEWTNGTKTTFSWWGEPPGGWQPLTPFVERVLALGEQGAVDEGKLRPSVLDAVRAVDDRESFRTFVEALAADLEARAVASPPSAGPDAVELLARHGSRLAPEIQHEIDPWRALADALRAACENDEPQRAQKPS